MATEKRPKRRGSTSGCRSGAGQRHDGLSCTRGGSSKSARPHWQRRRYGAPGARCAPSQPGCGHQSSMPVRVVESLLLARVVVPAARRRQQGKDRMDRQAEVACHVDGECSADVGGAVETATVRCHVGDLQPWQRHPKLQRAEVVTLVTALLLQDLGDVLGPLPCRCSRSTLHLSFDHDVLGEPGEHLRRLLGDPAPISLTVGV